jgi:hypothetical protein
MARRRSSRPLAPRPSVPDPRPHLLRAVLTFVRSARSTPGLLRIALLGSLVTDNPLPKDADVLVSIDANVGLAPLARLGRRLQGTAQTINLGADIFLADTAGHYLGRICHYRSAHIPVATYRRTLWPYRRIRMRFWSRSWTMPRARTEPLPATSRLTRRIARATPHPGIRQRIGSNPDAICSARALPPLPQTRHSGTQVIGATIKIGFDEIRDTRAEAGSLIGQPE